MTLALGVRCADGLVLAADSRVSGGSLGVADMSEKFLQVNRDVGIMTYGLATPGYGTMRALVEEVRSRPGRYVTMREIVNRASKEASKQLTRYIKKNPQLADESVGFIVAGYDGNETGTCKIFTFASTDGFTVREDSEFIAAQWPLPSLLASKLAFAGMSVTQGVNLAVILMVLTAAFEPTVGGPIRLAMVTVDRGFSLLSENQAQELVQSNQNRLLGLKMAWAEAW